MRHNIVSVSLEGKKPIHVEIGGDMAKADEIQLMELLEKAFTNTNTYLQSFFAPALTTWVSGQIKDDFPPDVSGWLIDAKFKAEKQILDLQAEVKRLTVSLDLLKDDTQKRDYRLNDIIAGLHTELQQQRQDEEKAMAETLGDLASVKHELNVANGLLAEKKQEIIELKAKLFDMIVKEGR